MAERVALVRLRQELRRDLAAAERLLAELRPRIPLLDAAEDSVLAGYAAITLHQLYTALETGFERICRTFEGDLPPGAESHLALLRDMSLDLPAIRPAVIDVATLEALLPLLRFRHFVRHAYAVAWDQRRLREIWEAADRAWPLVTKDLEEFLEFVQATAEELAGA